MFPLATRSELLREIGVSSAGNEGSNKPFREGNSLLSTSTIILVFFFKKALSAEGFGKGPCPAQSSAGTMLNWDSVLRVHNCEGMS